MAVKNYTGIKFNYLTAIKFEFRENNKTFWTLNCVCGKECIKQIDKVVHGSCKSCGCKNQKGKYKKSNIESSFNYVYHRYKQSANKREISFELTKEDFKRITSLNCHYCNIEPLQIAKYYNKTSQSLNYIYNGIDRINNDVGYILNNSTPCCFVCNRAKREMGYLDFLSYIDRLKKHIIINIH